MLWLLFSEKGGLCGNGGGIAFVRPGVVRQVAFHDAVGGRFCTGEGRSHRLRVNGTRKMPVHDSTRLAVVVN